MANKNNQDFWQSLINKYRDRTNELEQREQELMLRTEMLQRLIDDRKFETTSMSSLPIESTQRQVCKCRSYPGTPELEQQKTSFFHNLIKALLDRIYSSQEHGQQIGDTRAGTQEVSTSTTRLRQQTATGECGCSRPPPIAQQQSQISVRPETAPNTTNDKFDIFSLKSEDLIQIDNLQKLLNDQKNLDKHIKELEQKERIYREFLKERKNVDQNPQLSENNWINKKSTNFDENKQLCELRLENLLLKNELKDLKADIRQNLERIEGPMQFKVETERYKCIKLEEQLEQQTKEFLQQQQADLNEINALRMELSNTNATLFQLNQCNQELNQMKQQLEAKIQQLEDDLIRQKLSDFETIKHLNEALEQQQQQANQTAQATQRRESCNLQEIARQLSETLREVGPSGETSTLPPDIQTTAQYVRELAVLVDNRLPPTVPRNVPPAVDAGAPSAATTVPRNVPPAVDAGAPSAATTVPRNVPPAVDTGAPSAAIEEPVVVHAEQATVENEQAPPPTPVETPQTNAQGENITPFVRTPTPPCICVTPLDDNAGDDVVVVMPTNENITSQSSRSLNQAESEAIVPEQQPPQSVSQTRADERPPQLPQTRADERPPQLPSIPETQVEILDQPCENVDLTATITKSGKLEVLTKGPEGVVEGSIQKNPSGSIQFTAEIKLRPPTTSTRPDNIDSVVRCIQAAEQIGNQEANVNQEANANQETNVNQEANVNQTEAVPNENNQ